jgi:DNA-binding NarL/FixJ family response regulator
VYQTRVLVVDDHDIVRRGICSILSADSEFDIICEILLVHELNRLLATEQERLNQREAKAS